LFLAAAVSMGFTACGGKDAVEKSIDKEHIAVTVSILPQEYFVQRIAGDRARVNVMIPPGHSPATYEPTPRQMRELSASSLYFRIGHIPFEKAWLENIASANPAMKIVDTSVGVELIDTRKPLEGEDHDHDEAEADHVHTGIDPHIWLSPKAVKIQAGHIRDALAAHDPAYAETYNANYRAFAADIDTLHKEIAAGFAGLGGRRFMVFHPAWGYFGRDYGLVQLPVEVGGKTPSPRVLKQVIDTAKKENIKVIFVQKQFDTHSAEAVAADINGKVIQLDPLAPDWLGNMKKIAAALKEALK
jgi:zinc transport system substrate-binding protein